VILHVAAREYAGQAGLRAVVRDDVAVGVQLELALEQVGVGLVPDRHEHAGHVDGALFAGIDVEHLHAADLAVLLDDLRDHGVPPNFDLRVGQRAVRHDLAGPEIVPPMDDRDRVRETGEERALLHRRIPTADDGDVLVTEEEPVACGARRNAVAEELLLAGDTERPPVRAGREDDRLCPVQGVTDPDVLHVARQLDACRIIGEHLSAEPFGLFAHAVHEVRTHDAVGEARIILDVGGGSHLPARHDALDEERLQHGARGVDARRVAGGA